MKIADSIASPSKWITLSLDSVGIWTGGGTPSTNHREYWDNGTIPWVSPKDMKSCKIVESIDSITGKALSQSTAKLIPNNSILIVVRSGILKRMLPVAIAKVDVTTNQDLQSITPATGILSYFLYWSIVANGDQIRNDCAKDGTTVDSIDLLKLKSFFIKVPPLPEQRAIVAKIELLFSELDAGVASLEAAKAQLKVYRQAVLNAAFRIKRKGTPIERLESACAFITKGTTPPKEAFMREGGIPFIKVYNLTFRGVLDFSVNPVFIPRSIHNGELRRSIILPGDVLMNIVGPPLGKVSIVPSTFQEWNINQAIARFRCTPKLDNKYLSYFLMDRSTVDKLMKKSKATAGQINLTLEICRDIEIPLPNIDEQVKIVSEIESRFSLADKLEETIDASLAQAASLRQSVLKRAFEGKLLTQEELEACRREPDWECAEELLERIKAERAASDEGRATAAQRKRAGNRSRAS